MPAEGGLEPGPLPETKIARVATSSAAPRSAELAGHRFSSLVAAPGHGGLIIHGAFPEILERVGFIAVSVQDITERVMPMLKWFAQLGYVPCQLGRLLRLQGELVNCTSAVEGYRHRRVWRHNIVTAERPR